MITINMAIVAVIGLHSVWCLLSRRVSDGVVGKVLYLLLALAVLGVLSNPGSMVEQMTLNASMAAIAVRHWFMKTFWPRIRRKMLNRIRCATCPHKD